MNFISNRTCKLNHHHHRISAVVFFLFCFGSFTKVHYTKCLIADGYYKVLSKTKSKHFFLSSPNQLLLRQVKLLKIKIFLFSLSTEYRVDRCVTTIIQKFNESKRIIHMTSDVVMHACMHNIICKENKTKQKSSFIQRCIQQENNVQFIILNADIC